MAKTLKMAPDAPNDAVESELLINVGIATEINDEITAELTYITKKLDAPTNEHNAVPNECNTNMLNKMCMPSWWENADPKNDHTEYTLSLTKSPYRDIKRAPCGDFHARKPTTLSPISP